MSDSILCRRCGHTRADHFGTFTGPVAKRGCHAKKRDDQGWATGPCDCTGYQPLQPGEAISELPFAAPDVLPPLRIVHADDDRDAPQLS